MTRWTVREPRRLELPDQVERLHVHLVRGRVSVVAQPGPARIEVSAVGKRPVEIDHQAGRLTVRHEASRRNPFWWWWSARRFHCEVTLAIPADAVAEVRVVHGRVALSGLREKTTVDVTSGKVSLLGLAGLTRAKLVSGPVEALGLGGDVSLESVSGDLTVAQSSADRVQATTVSGTITCDLDSVTPADIRLNTTSGDVTIRVPAECDADVRLNAVSGRIHSSFELVQEGNRQRWTRSAAGRIGSGTGRLTATTTSGTIALLAAEQ